MEWKTRFQKKTEPEQIVALNIYRFHFRIGDLKNYHKMVKELMHDKVQELTNYENFLKATNKSAVFIISFMNFLMRLNRMNGFCRCWLPAEERDSEAHGK